jgi:hypothetical protein
MINRNNNLKNFEFTTPSQNGNLNCTFLIIVACYMMLLLVLSTILNGTNLWIFYKNKLFNPINYMMITLLSFNFVAVFFIAIPMIYNGFNCK